jgi:hypothetical protein
MSSPFYGKEFTFTQPAPLSLQSPYCSLSVGPLDCSGNWDRAGLAVSTRVEEHNALVRDGGVGDRSHHCLSKASTVPWMI